MGRGKYKNWPYSRRRSRLFCLGGWEKKGNGNLKKKAKGEVPGWHS